MQRMNVYVGRFAHGRWVRWATVVCIFVAIGGFAAKCTYSWMREHNVRRQIVALGGEYWRIDAYRICTANLSNTSVSDEQLKAITANRDLFVLTLSGTSVTGVGLVSAGSTTSLFLDGTRCNDGAMAVVCRVPGVEHLDLSHTRVTDRGIVCLKHSGIESLALRGTGVAESVGDVLSGMQRLKYVDLSETSITDAGLLKLRSVSLERVQLNWTHISDGGVIALKSCPNLKQLEIANTHVTGASLVAMKSWNRLQYLEIDENLDTLEEIEELRRVRPDISIGISHDAAPGKKSAREGPVRRQ